ncbi:hypothetical protein ABIF30_006534 [Bradyrhizobium elkanii]
MTHFEKFAEHIMSDDDSELGKVKAERDYALHCLEREIALCSQAETRLNEAVKLIYDLLGLERGSGERAFDFLDSDFAQSILRDVSEAVEAGK